MDIVKCQIVFLTNRSNKKKKIYIYIYNAGLTDSAGNLRVIIQLLYTNDTFLSSLKKNYYILNRFKLMLLIHSIY